MIGYKVYAIDGDIGHIPGLLLEDNSWDVRYLIIDTNNWFGGHKVLISPE
ncbi:PRC-barrel domain-containing protein [Marinomonas primoryensis]